MKKILIIDDNSNLTSYLEKKLSAAGHEVVVESTGLAGLHRLTEYVPDIIFTDFFLPDINGDDLCKIIRNMDYLKQCYLVLMSAAAKEMELDPEKTIADSIIAKGTFKETAEFFFSSLEAAAKPPGEQPPERIHGLDAVHPRRMTIELLQKNRHLRIILDSISEGILEIYRGQIIYANPAAEIILGKPQDLMLAAYPTTLFPEIERPKIQSLIDAGDKGSEVFRTDGPFNYGNKLLSLKKLSHQGDSETVILLIADITEKIHNEEALHNYRVHLETIIEERTADLNRTMEKLQQSQKMEAIGILAGGVAHDLNNILNPILVYPELLLLDLPEDSPLKPILLTIKDSAEKAAAIVQDLLTMARRGVQAYEPLNLNSVIANYLESPEYNKLISSYPDVSLETRFDEDLLIILGSRVQLSKTIMNLVTNAAEAMPRGGRVSVSTETRYVDRPIKIKNSNEEIPEGEYVALMVSDEGVGISPEDLPRIFDPFFTKKKMGHSGTGLGMTIVWGAVKDHRGYIEVNSVLGTGTVFKLYFPITRQELVPHNTKIPLEQLIGKGETILVVDDIKEQRDMISLALTSIGYTVSMVSSGEEAVEFIEHTPVDLLLLDMIMEPGIDGLETYRRICAIRPGQKAVIASGYSEEETIAQCLSLGIGQFVKKPYTLEKIGLVVRQELDKIGS